MVATSSAERSRERLAWRIVLAAFAVFVLGLLCTPLAIRWYLNTATSARPVVLDVIRGTVLYLPAGGRQETIASQHVEMSEGDQVRTTADSQAILSLPDGSNVQLRPETTVQVIRLRASIYNNRTTEFIFLQKTGRSRVEVAPPSADYRKFEVRTPHSSALLHEGSYGVEVAESATEVSVRLGSASVSAGDRTVEILHNERTVVAAGEPPATPQPAARNYVQNGDFTGRLEGWQSGSRNVEDGNPGEISIVEQDGLSIVRFTRRGSSKHAETYIHQQVDADVSDLQTLKLKAQLKVLRQSLSGGGWVGSEYPLAIRVRYRDASGSETTWVRGFYAQNVEDRPTHNGLRVGPNLWVPFVADLFDPSQVYPRPAQILWVEIEASGWEYESMVTGVELVGE